jgi:hypothetical protein
MTVSIELLLPHTHAGQVCIPGDRIDLEDSQAAWLIRIGVARPFPPDTERAIDSLTNPVPETDSSIPTREKRR